MLELKPASPELEAEIDLKQTKVNGTNAQIVFKNSSYIKVVTASDSARGKKYNCRLWRMILFHKLLRGKIGESLTANTEITY